MQTDPRVLLADIIESQASPKSLSEAGDSEKLLRAEEQLDEAVVCSTELQRQLGLLREQHRASLAGLYEKQQASTAIQMGTVTSLQERINWWEEACKSQAVEHNARLLSTVAERDAKQLSLTASESSLSDARGTVEKLLLREEVLKSKSAVRIPLSKKWSTRRSCRSAQLDATTRSWR